MIAVGVTEHEQVDRCTFRNDLLNRLDAGRSLVLVILRVVHHVVTVGNAGTVHTPAPTSTTRTYTASAGTSWASPDDDPRRHSREDGGISFIEHRSQERVTGHCTPNINRSGGANATTLPALETKLTTPRRPDTAPCTPSCTLPTAVSSGRGDGTSQASGQLTTFPPRR